MYVYEYMNICMCMMLCMYICIGRCKCGASSKMYVGKRGCRWREGGARGGRVCGSCVGPFALC